MRSKPKLRTLALRLGSRCNSSRIHTGTVVINQSITDSVYFSMCPSCFFQAAVSVLRSCLLAIHPSVRPFDSPRSSSSPAVSFYWDAIQISAPSRLWPEWLPPSQSPAGTGTLLRPPTPSLLVHSDMRDAFSCSAFFSFLPPPAPRSVAVNVLLLCTK